MQRIRSEFDSDRKTISEPTDYETSENRFELLCGMCGAPVFVDRTIYERLNAAVEQGLEDNPVVCGECETDFDEERLAD
jgi:hypothetical protein